MLQFEWPRRWSEEDRESVRAAIEHSIREAMARGSGNAQIRGLVSVDAPNLGKQSPKIKLDGIRSLSLHHTAINLHFEYNGDFEITLRGLQVNLDTLNSSYTNDNDANKTMPFFCPFVLTITNLVLDGMASVEITHEFKNNEVEQHRHILHREKSETSMQNLKHNNDAFYCNNNNAEKLYNSDTLLCNNRRKQGNGESTEWSKYNSIYNLMHTKSMSIEFTNDDNSEINNTINTNINNTANITYLHQQRKIASERSGSKNLEQISSLANATSSTLLNECKGESEAFLLARSENILRGKTEHSCHADRMSLTVTSPSSKVKTGFGVLFAAGGRRAMRKPATQQTRFAELESNNKYTARTMFTQHVLGESNYENNNNKEKKSCEFCKSNALVEYHDDYKLCTNRHCKFNDKSLNKISAYNSESCKYSSTNGNYDTRMLNGDCTINNLYRNRSELMSSEPTCIDRYDGIHNTKYTAKCTRNDEVEFCGSCCNDQSHYKKNNNTQNIVNNNGKDVSKNKFWEIDECEKCSYDDAENITTSAHIIDLLEHKLSIRKRVVKVQLFGDPLKSFSVITNFGTVPGVDNRVQETIKMLIKPTIERMMLDGLTIIQ